MRIPNFDIWVGHNVNIPLGFDTILERPISKEVRSRLRHSSHNAYLHCDTRMFHKIAFLGHMVRGGEEMTSCLPLRYSWWRNFLCGRSRNDCLFEKKFDF